MTALAASANRADTTAGPGVHAPTAATAATDRSSTSARPGKTVRSWPLLILAVPAAAEVWSGWVGIAQKTGFGLVSPLPGLWSSLRIDTAITLPIGVEAYAAYALRAWLSSGHTVSSRTRRFAKWSAIFSFALGMAGQVAYHLLAQAGLARAPWAITTIVSCLPVLVLAMGTTLAHMLHADAAATDVSDGRSEQVTSVPTPESSFNEPVHPQPSLAIGEALAETRLPVSGESDVGGSTHRPAGVIDKEQLAMATAAAAELQKVGQRVSRRTLRAAGIHGSNADLGRLARILTSQLPALEIRLPSEPPLSAGAFPKADAQPWDFPSARSVLGELPSGAF